MDYGDMNPPREDIFSKDSKHENTDTCILEKISCETELELSEGSEKILRSHNRWLFSFFRGKLNSHRLQHKYSEWEILGEAYQRATKTLRRGEKICNLYGWYKATGYNIIREYSRKEIKQREIRSKLEISLNQSTLSAEKIELSLNQSSSIVKTIKKAVKNKIDIKIIWLRILDDLSWVEVCEVLIRDGDLNCELSKQCTERVRQRFHRALKKIPKLKE